MSTEREDLDNLLKSPGWQRLEAWAHADLTQKINQHTEAAANESDDVQALNKLRQMIAAKRAVELVLHYPKTRLKMLDGATTSDANANERAYWAQRRGGI